MLSRGVFIAKSKASVKPLSWLGLAAKEPVTLAARAITTSARSVSAPATVSTPSSPSQPASSKSPESMAFPCLDKVEQRTKMIADLGPDPAYSKATGYQVYRPEAPLGLDYGRELEKLEVAYETWGTLNSDRSNAVLLHTGLSASSHAKSHPANPAPGWWEKFIGPGLSIDTNKFFVICTNVIGGCYGSTGPSSLSPSDGKHYATRFPIVSIQDMVRIQHRLVTEELGIKKLYASVGSSMGGMQSLAYATDFSGSVDRVVSISACARSHPSSIAMRHVQRQALMGDPNWKRGFYYDGIPPHVGMKLARELATITYRSGPEWEERFGRDRVDPSKPPALCPDFLIETYLDHQGEKFCLQYDPNSLLYVSKAMDLFDLGSENAAARSRSRAGQLAETDMSQCVVPDKPYKEQPRDHVQTSTTADLVHGIQPMAHLPTLVLGVQSDVLFPVWQQREIADVLREAAGPNNDHIEYRELNFDHSKFGHDTFLLDLENIGKPVKTFLERDL